MKIYRKKGGKILVITVLKGGGFGGTEVVFMNYSLKGTLQSVILSYYEYVREATPEEIEEFGKKF